MSAGKVTGLASGFDTQSIVDGLMKIEKIPYDKLDVKKQTEELKLQAYQAVNTYLLKFRTSMNSLSSRKLWNSKAAVSTNDKVVTATANEYVANGSYSFKVAQLAAATQYMSRGFSSAKAPLVKQDSGQPPYSLGTINLASAKTRVDTSAKLDTLNGGKGIFRGSVRVTDASNSTSIIDLSSCDTLDDVARALSDSTGAQINAFIDKDGRLCVEDASNGSGDMKIQNVGAGTTATDLGLVGGTAYTTADGTKGIQGNNAYTLGTDLQLGLLNDGLGVEDGTFRLVVTDSVGKYLTIDADITDCSTVGEVVNRVNAAIQAQRDKGGTGSGGLEASAIADLRFTVSSDKRSFALVGTEANMSYQFGDLNTDAMGNATPADQLGLTESGRQTAKTKGEEIKFNRVLGSANSPMLKTLGGVDGTGVGASVTSDSGMVPQAFNLSTPLKYLNGGKGLDTSRPMQLRIYEGGQEDGKGKVSTLTLEQVIKPEDMDAFMTANPNGTVGDLVTFLNTKMAEYANDPSNIGAAAVKGLRFDYDTTNDVLVINGAQSGYTYEFGGTVIGNLGLSRGISADGNGTEVKETDQPTLDQLKAFYGMDNASLLANNKFIGSDTKLENLVALAGIAADPTAYPKGGDPLVLDEDAWVAACVAKLQNQSHLDSLFNPAGSFQISTTNSANQTITLNVDWADVFTNMNETPPRTAASADMNVEKFIEAINKTIKDEAAGQTFSNGEKIHAPQINVKDGASLQWSNVDFTQTWNISGLDASLGLNVNSATIVDPVQQGVVYPTSQPTPMAPGYFVKDPVTASTPLSSLNYMAGMAFVPGETIGFDFGNGKTIAISTDDIIGAMSGYGAGATIGDYVSELNTILAAELGTLGGAVSFTFGFDSNGLTIEGLTGADKLKISGDSANSFLSGIGAMDMDIGVSGAPASISLGELSPVHIETKPIEGLGEIALTLGNGSELRLSTDGITAESTLNELIAKLNSELDALVTKNPPPAGYTAADLAEFANIRFTLNDTGTGIAVENNSKYTLTFHDTKDAGGNSDNQYLAQDLGLVGSDNSSVRVESYSFHNSGSLNRQYISRATKLSEYIGANAEMGGLQLTDSTGQIRTVGLENCKTVGDLLDAINMFAEDGFGIGARINAKGDGIELIEGWLPGMMPSEDKISGVIKVEDVQGGTVGKKFGIAGTAKRADAGTPAKIDGSMSTTIEVMSNDSLESIMYRIAESGNYKCATVNDGSGTNPYRLSITAANTGEASDFVISSDIDLFGFNQTSRGRDAKVLYGDPNSSSNPVMLSSSTNSISDAIYGMTLDVKSVSSEWSTITVDTDKEKVTEEIKNMVTAYNDLANIITMLDAYDEETGEPGILFGDSSVRSMMDSINEFFYMIYNPNNLSLGSTDENGKLATWTWMDIGVDLTAQNTNADGTGSWYTTMTLDEDKLADMVASNWTILADMLGGERNASNKNNNENVKPSASFNGELADGNDVENAINGNTSKAGAGTTNGITAADTIANGANAYTIIYQQPTTLTRMSIYFQSPETALKDYVVEYLNPNTGEWVEYRSLEGNSSDTAYFAFTPPTTVGGIRIKASSTNAEDGKFRLLDVQTFEQTGLAGKLNQLVNELGDVSSGFLASRNEEVQSSISDIKEQMERLQSRLDAKEESLWRRFTTMETALAKLQNQGDYFSSMMGSFSNNNK